MLYKASYRGIEIHVPYSPLDIMNDVRSPAPPRFSMLPAVHIYIILFIKLEDEAMNNNKLFIAF